MSKSLISNFSDEEFIELVKSSESFTDLIYRLGFSQVPGNESKKKIRKRISDLCLNMPVNEKHRNLTKEEILEAINSTKTMKAAAIKLNLSIKTLKRLSLSYGIWNPNPGVKEEFIRSAENEKNKEKFIEKLHKDSKIKTSFLRESLIKYNLKNNSCEVCGLSKWNDFDIPLDVHHIDGDNKNNELSNLKIICPNCHRQTENHGTKNQKFKDNAKKRKSNMT